MSLELSLVLMAFLLMVYMHVWSNRTPVTIDDIVKVIDRRWHVRDRSEGGFFIFVEVL